MTTPKERHRTERKEIMEEMEHSRVIKRADDLISKSEEKADNQFFDKLDDFINKSKDKLSGSRSASPASTARSEISANPQASIMSRSLSNEVKGENKNEEVQEEKSRISHRR